jgi:hypothetical protein
MWKIEKEKVEKIMHKTTKNIYIITWIFTVLYLIIPELAFLFSSHDGEWPLPIQV